MAENTNKTPLPVLIVTGGAGYIGSHTIIEIIQSGQYRVVSVDNYSNSSPRVFERIQTITGQVVENHNVDVSCAEDIRQVFSQYADIAGVIHFAALKSVGESVEKPLSYYSNNLNSLLNVLACCEEFGVDSFIFSSSCSVYGNVDQLPVTEQTPIAEAESPYAYTKVVGEKIVEDVISASNHLRGISLRYFNPVGGHDSGLNGEDPRNLPSNLVPVITLVAQGQIPSLTVFGDDYETRDGTCVRDYIHVSDIADAHLKAFQYLKERQGEDAGGYEVFNLGSGKGVTVLEAIQAFEKISKQKLSYSIGPRRAGDVVSIYADNSRAEQTLNWTPTRDIEDMMRSAWAWQQYLGRQ